MTNWILKTWVCVLLLVTASTAQDNLADQSQQEHPAVYGEFPIHTEQVKAAYKANLEKYKGNEDILVLPGLVADRQSHRVALSAEATGIAPDTIIEFLLIAPDSDRGYEALLWSYARPSDVHRALEFIGMKPGKPFHPGMLRFWPKGERVIAHIAADNSDKRVPLESLVIDKNTGQSLPEVGFVFTGSLMVTSAGDSTRQSYAADVMDPKSIASLYNDMTTVMDIPRHASKEALYGTQLVGPNYTFDKNEQVTISLQPEREQRVVDLTLDIRESKDSTKNESQLPGEFLLTDENGDHLTEQPELPSVLGVFGSLVEKGRDPFVSVRFDLKLPLTDVRKVCKLLDMIDSDHGIHIEPPAAGQLYYKAFLPSLTLLDRQRRVFDPWEVHLGLAGNKINATLMLHESAMIDGKIKTKETSIEVDSAETLSQQHDEDAARRKAAELRPRPPVLLVFAESNLTYGQLVNFLAPTMKTHNVIHVFLTTGK